MRYLVTGGAGFIGSHIVETLLKKGLSPQNMKGLSPKGTDPKEKAKGTDPDIKTNKKVPVPEVRPEDIFVRVLDNFSSGKRENLNFTCDLRPATCDIIEGDIRDKSTCDIACRDIDYVLHQAALRSVPKSMTTPHEYNAVNIDGTLNMLEAARDNKVKRFVFASSSAIYGDVDEFPEREDFLPKLISPYALSKLTGEYYCRIFSEHFSLETVCLRYFNVFGPRQALDDEYAVVIPKFIHCILHDEQPPIFGTGKQSRDFTYIDNVVEANILAATKGLSPQNMKGLSPKGTDPEIKTKGTVPEVMRPATCDLRPNIAFHEVFNVANGKDNTVLQLVEYLNKIIGKDIKPQFLPVRPGDVFRTLADISKIKTKLGFQPKVDFEGGLRRTVEYFVTEGTVPADS